MNQALIDQYVAGHLGEQEAEEFEAYCLEHPEFAQQVEYEQLLKAGVAHVARVSPQEFAAPRDTSWRWRLALAASVIAASGIVLYSWSPNAAAVPPILEASGGEHTSGGRVLRLAMVRGAEGMPELPAGRARVEIVGMFEPGVDYTITLTGLEERATQPVATLEHQRASSTVTMQVLVDGDRLTPGAYTLRVRRPESADEPLDFVFVKP